MKQALVIVTWAGSIDVTLPPLLQSLADYKKYPQVIVVNEAPLMSPETRAYLDRNYILLENKRDLWECGAIAAVLHKTDIDEFVLLQDTLLVVDPTVFDQMFNEFKGKSVCFGITWQCYLGKYRREILEQIKVPVTTLKKHSMFQEVAFVNNYLQKEGLIYSLFEEWGDNNPGNRIEEFYGRTNLVLDNPYILKFKATISSGDSSKTPILTTFNVTWDDLFEEWQKTGQYFKELKESD